MKLSLNWIKDYVKIPENLEMSQLAYDLTMSTVEVEGMIELASKFNSMVIGVINEVIPHPNADKLKICKVDIGDEVREIVCGGSNVCAEMKIVVAKPGALVRWHGEGDLVEIKNAKLRGVESYGMICASSEIGLFDLFPFSEEATILDLSEFNVKAGTSVAEALDLNDVILEIDNKSLTNRPDLWGHFGIAREIAALYNLELNFNHSFNNNLEFKEVLPLKMPTVADFKVQIDNTEKCSRYIGVKIEGLSTKPAPFAMQSRIWRVGMRPINAIVDVTNYVMLATGQPTHAFDADNIKGNITVRNARNAEKLRLLDSKELMLTVDDLVIADSENSVALAGVMGGEKDSILPETNKIILEIANFEARSIRRTSARYETRTEAATRFEKAIDSERCNIALSLAMSLFSQLYPDLSITGFSDNFYKNDCKIATNPKRNTIEISLRWLEKRLGKQLPNAEIADKLQRLGFDVNFYNEKISDSSNSGKNCNDKSCDNKNYENNCDKISNSADMMRVIAPTWRSTGDISIPDDIVEEIARMHGYENFEPAPITTSFEAAINQIEIDLERKIKEFLAFSCGMREIFTYPWMNDEFIRVIFPENNQNQKIGEMLSLATPPAPNERYIRSSLLPNICKAIVENLRFFDEFAIFEAAQIFSNSKFTSLYDSREFLPQNRRNIAGAFVGNSGNLNQLFRRAKGIIQAIPRFSHTKPLAFEQTEKPAWADNVIWLNINHCGDRIGNLALLSKKSAIDCGIKNSIALLFELDVDSLKPFPSRTNQFQRLPEYPMTDYDISMLFDLSVNWEEILAAIMSKKSADELLHSVDFVGEYRGKQVPNGKKSITFRLVIGSLKKTLTSDEINGCTNRIIKYLSKIFNAEIRK